MGEAGKGGRARYPPAVFLQRLRECCNASLSFLFVGNRIHEHADTSHPIRGLTFRHERPSG
jgi:hypothetical protein